MAAGNKKLGDHFKLWVNTSTVSATPTYTELTCANNLSFALGSNLVEVPCRGDQVIGSLSGKRRFTFSFSLLYNPGDTASDAIITAALAGTSKQMAISDGDIVTTGTKYLHGDAVFEQPSIDLNLGSAAEYTITAAPNANYDATVLSTTLLQWGSWNTAP